MTGRIPDQALAPFFVALTIGAAALISAPLSLLLLSALAAHTLTRSPPARFNALELAGPVLSALTVGAFVGLAGAIGTLFVWRLYSDVRWSAREAARLAHAAGRPAEASLKSLAHAWLAPFYGLCLVAYTAPHMIAGLPLDLPHVPVWVPLAAGIVATGAVFDWALRRAADWRLGELASAPALHLLTHHALFLLAFGVTLDVSAGIVALMAWRMAHAAPLKLPQASFTAVP